MVRMRVADYQRAQRLADFVEHCPELAGRCAEELSIHSDDGRGRFNQKRIGIHFTRSRGEHVDLCCHWLLSFLAAASHAAETQDERSTCPGSGLSRSTASFP